VHLIFRLNVLNLACYFRCVIFATKPNLTATGINQDFLKGSSSVP